MSNDNKDQENEDVERTGGEAKLQEELKAVDEEVGERIKDKPYSKESREERRRGRFIDLHADEDNDPSTTEATYRGEQGQQDDSVDSTSSTTSTTSTSSTTSTTSTNND